MRFAPGLISSGSLGRNGMNMRLTVAMDKDIIAWRAADFYFRFVPALWNAEPIPLGSRESKKEKSLSELSASRRSAASGR